ncbi:hypothetical protein [Streptomyces viridochromogenes]|uniref:hypothetical protein n=1 Tax=Streptomyces viridochromogenes TaxID=1938 RepID=UPI00069F8834|nr:hypothetical protein [Streptomyces viridochromogenes]KOG19684.1 hypothetical protein ADK35_19525 [Streptomyces viridochromogenes]KOG22382.1 hypothetical protein ADK36_11140 [Streptomyces viridochromogenes]
MLRLRIKVIEWPRRAIAIVDTPRPDCPLCHGNGGHSWTCVTHDGEYDGTDFELCTCWNDELRIVLLPLPRWTRRTPPGGYSDEPPF